jgi:hypothetical protein
MPNKRPNRARRPVPMPEAVLTAALVTQWKSDPSSVPREWRGFWESMTEAAPVEDLPPSLFDDPAREAWAALSDEERHDEERAWRESEEPPALEPVAPLDAVSLGLAVVQRAESDLAALVRAAHAAGASWTEIGAAMAMTKQAAYKRFAGG